MFVAHHLITIEKVFRKEILTPDTSSESRERAKADVQKSQLGFLVTKIRRLGNDGFGEHVELKQKEMCDNLDDATGKTARFLFYNWNFTDFAGHLYSTSNISTHDRNVRHFYVRDHSIQDQLHFYLKAKNVTISITI